MNFASGSADSLRLPFMAINNSNCHMRAGFQTAAALCWRFANAARSACLRCRAMARPPDLSHAATAAFCCPAAQPGRAHTSIIMSNVQSRTCRSPGLPDQSAWLQSTMTASTYQDVKTTSPSGKQDVHLMTGPRVGWVVKVAEPCKDVAWAKGMAAACPHLAGEACRPLAGGA